MPYALLKLAAYSETFPVDILKLHFKVDKVVYLFFEKPCLIFMSISISVFCHSFFVRIYKCYAVCTH
jgi:hypothetical protein